MQGKKPVLVEGRGQSFLPASTARKYKRAAAKSFVKCISKRVIDRGILFHIAFLKLGARSTSPFQFLCVSVERLSSWAASLIGYGSETAVSYSPPTVKLFLKHATELLLFQITFK